MTLLKNSDYKKDGLKSYAYLLQRRKSFVEFPSRALREAMADKHTDNISLTIDGLFHMVSGIVQKFHKNVFRKAHMQGWSLLKEDARGYAKKLSADDI